MSLREDELEQPLPKYKQQTLEDYKQQAQAEQQAKNEERLRRNQMVEDDEDEYFESMLKEFQKQERTDKDNDDDIEYFAKHPLTCKKLTDDVLNQPEFKALQELAYDGSPKEVFENFLEHALESTSDVLLKNTKTVAHDAVECERAFHFFTQAWETEYREPEALFKWYMGRAKLNLVTAQFGHCKTDSLEALKIKPNNENMWVLLTRSRYFIEKYEDGLKYAREGLEKCPHSHKLANMKAVHEEGLKKEGRILEEITTLKSLKQDKQLDLYRMLRDKKIKMGKKINYIPENQEAQITIDKQGKIHFPLLILWDEFMQTDYIQDCPEDQTLRQALTPVFSQQAPWDKEEDYSMQTIEVYFEADQTKPLDFKDVKRKKCNKKHVKLDLKQTIGEVLAMDYHIVPQYPVLKVICSDNDFKDSFLAQI